MAEPIRREDHKTARGESQYARDELYATDVLLIADAAAPGQNPGRGGESETPLDMEGVVRKLIALLSDQ